MDSSGQTKTPGVGEEVASGEWRRTGLWCSPEDEPWPCTDCGSTELACVCFFAQSCPDCDEDWSWCECERAL